MLKVFCAKKQDAKTLVKKLLKAPDLIFDANQYGKPFVVNMENIFFNATHTQTNTFIVFSHKEIGIDAEEIEQYDNRIPLDYFTSDEQEYLNGCNNKSKAFFEIWTLKESYMKYKGKGFHIPPQSFSIRKDCGCSFYHEIVGDIALSICTKRQQPVGEICFFKET